MNQVYDQKANTSPLNFENIELADVIDASAIQEMMNDYFALTGIGIGIIDLKGNVLVGTGWQDICVNFHRAVPESCKICYECDTALSSGVPPGTFKTCLCKNNLWDMATPIMLGERHIGNIFLGQFLYDDEEPDYDLFRAQAKRFGYDETAYIAALDKVSRFSRHTVQTAMRYYSKLAQMISRSNYNNIVLEQALTERKRAEETLMPLQYELQRQNEALQVNEEELRTQNDDLLATEEMLRVQISEYEVSQKLLKESSERFRALHEASFGGVLVHENGVILECNQGLSEMTGYSVEELIGMQSIQLILEEYQEEVAAKIREGFTELYEVEGIRKDGTRYHVRIRGKSIFYMGRSVRVTDMRDITDRKLAEEEHKQLEHKFHQAQKLESLGVLAGGIAHDFNNILTVIMGHCYMAKENMIPEHQFKAAFRKIETAGGRAKDLCRQMLTYAGKSPMEQTQFNLWLLVDEVVKMLQAAIKKNVTIELDLKSDVPEINGDTGQIQQIVMNFIINSAEAIGDGNGTIRVVLTKIVFEGDGTEKDTFGTVIKAGAYACLEVTDTGCGMDEATQKQIFEPFFTTKSTGRGLGMSAIHGIIKTHGGALQLTSKPGIGTTFKVFLPIPPASDNSATALKTAVLTEDASGTILFVEDEELLRVMGKELLDAHGFTIMTASNGIEALEIYRERGSEIDVILMDLIMPVMGGIEAYHELRRINPIVPIVICSGYGVESIQDVIENDPHAGFIHKPYNPGELRDMLVRMMK